MNFSQGVPSKNSKNSLEKTTSKKDVTKTYIKHTKNTNTHTSLQSPRGKEKQKKTFHPIKSKNHLSREHTSIFLPMKMNKWKQ